MAVIDEIPGLEVTIVSNGGPLREYADPETHPSAKEVTKYIEVTGDGKFEILTKFLDNYAATYGVRVEVRLDGKEVDSQLIRLKDLKKSGGHKFDGLEEKIQGFWHKSKFSFWSIAVEKDSAQKLDQEIEDKLQRTGTINVIFHRAKNMQWPRPSKKVVEKKDTPPHGIAKFGQLPEQRVRELGLSHQGGIDKPIKNKTGKRLEYNYVDGKGDENAYAVFNFKYRSLAALQDQQIVPCTSPPVSLHAPIIATPPFNPPAPIVAAPIPVPQHQQHQQHQQQDLAVIHDDQDGLSKEELLAVIGSYRGHTKGLDALNMRSMSALLKHYEDKQDQQLPITGTKRAGEDTGALYGTSKRQCKDVIVLDT